MDDLERVRYVTRNYRELQGLTLIPVALGYLAWAASDFAGITRHMPWQVFVFMLALIGLTMYLISKWYERTYGWIDSGRGADREDRHHPVFATIFIASYIASFAMLGPVVEVSIIGLSAA